MLSNGHWHSAELSWARAMHARGMDGPRVAVGVLLTSLCFFMRALLASRARSSGLTLGKQLVS